MKIIYLIILITTSIFAQSEFSRTNGPYGGNVSDFEIHEDKLYVALNGLGGIYYLENDSWVLFDDGLPLQSAVKDLYSMDGNLYAGTDRYGIFLLKDQKWERFSDDKQVHQLLDLNGNLILVTKNNGIFITFDNGNTWEDITFNIPSSTIYNTYVYNNTIWCGTWKSGVQMLDLENKTWESRSDGINIGINTAITSIYSIDATLFCSDNEYLYLSENDGVLWQKSSVKYENSTRADYYYKSGDDLFSINNHLIHKIEDDSWSQVFQAGYTGITNFIEYDDNYYFSQNSWGIYKLDKNFNDSISVFAGISNSYLNRLAENDKYIFASELVSDYGFINRSSDGGDTWEANKDELSQIGYISIYAKDEIVLAGSDGVGLFISTNSGENWIKANGTKTGYLNSVIYHNGNIITGNKFTQNNEISLDFGESFSIIETLPKDGLVFLVEYNNNLYSVARSKGIFRSKDSGLNWEELNDGLIQGSSITLYDLYSDGNSLITCTYNEIFLFNSSSDNWIKLNFNNEEQLTAVMIKDNLIIATTKSKEIYFSLDKGQSFEKITGITEYSISIEDILYSRDRNVYFATTGYGVWKLPSSIFGIESVPNSRSMEIKVYPNPSVENIHVLGSDLKGEVLVELISAEGIVKYSQKFQNSNELIINLNKELHGSYFLKVVSGDRLALRLIYIK